MLNCKGYFGKVDFDADARMLYGQVVGTRDVITFAANSAKKVEKAFRDSVEDCLDYCARYREKPEKPASGSSASKPKRAAARRTH